MAKRKKKKTSLLGLLAAFALVVLGEMTGLLPAPEGASPSALGAETTVHFIDVGQGDAALIRSGDQDVLIDGGPGSDEDKLMAYLAAQNVTELDAIIATHPHEDHLGGLDNVLKTYPVETLYMPNLTANTKIFGRVLDYAEEQKTELVIPDIGDVFSFDSGATLTFLSPAADAQLNDANNASIVNLLEAGGKRVLFTGDAEVPVEEALLARNADISCDVIKIGHHGSHSSSSPDFMTRANPSIALISCAKQNDYGHPHRETIALLNERGIETHITAEEGSWVYEIPKTEGVAA